MFTDSKTHAYLEIGAVVRSVFTYPFYRHHLAINNLVGIFFVVLPVEKLTASVIKKSTINELFHPATFSWFHIAYLLLLVEQRDIHACL
uniref:hypothetical protein n=1 Tax=Salmonella sp. TaxID=599 RepID=UPI001CD9D1AB|nr:hypothetical protein [Salmonella sp.]